MEKRFNVYIVEDSSCKAITLIGENLSESSSEKREETGWNRIDSVNFSIESVEVGSEKDKKFQEDLEK